MFSQEGCKGGHAEQTEAKASDTSQFTSVKVAVAAMYNGRMRRGLCGLLRSACWNDVSLHLLHTDGWRGLGQKSEMMLAFLEALVEESQISGTRWIVMFVDSFDVLLQVSSEEIKRRYLESGHKVIISAENNCFPWNNNFCSLNLGVCNLFPQPTDPKLLRRYPNSGGIIGDLDSLMGVMKEVRRMPENVMWYWPGTDQGFIGQVYLSHRVLGWGIDSKSEFWATYNAGERFINATDGKSFQPPDAYGRPPPAALHFNGAGQKCFRTIEATAWYNRGRVDSNCPIETRTCGVETGSGSCPQGKSAETLVYEYDMKKLKFRPPQTLHGFYERSCSFFECDCQDCECSVGGDSRETCIRPHI